MNVTIVSAFFISDFRTFTHKLIITNNLKGKTGEYIAQKISIRFIKLIILAGKWSCQIAVEKGNINMTLMKQRAAKDITKMSFFLSNHKTSKIFTLT